MEQELAAQLIKAAQIVEEKVDEQLSQLAHLEKTSDENELEELRRKRMIELRKMQERKQELASNGHGRVEELSNEAEFFAASRKSTALVCHFFDPTNRASEVVNKTLEKIAAKYFSTRFIKLNADRVPFLIKRLNIRRLPTLGVAIDAQMVDFVRVLDEFGANVERYGLDVDAVEERLGRAGAIDYRAPPSKAEQRAAAKQTKITNLTRKKKTIRERNSSGSDDSGDW